jgi:hypothetical protein
MIDVTIFHMTLRLTHFATAVALTLFITLPMSADVRSRTHSASTHSASHSSHARSTARHTSPRAGSGVARDRQGRIKRSARAKNRFKKQRPCPSTGKSSGACPGYVIDHVKALKRGGEDNPSNMQWQTNEAAKQKDKWE